MAIQFIVDILNKVFDTKCLYDSSGKIVNGPGIICSFYIIIMIIGLIGNIYYSMEIKDKKTRIKNIIADLIHTTLSVLFMYHMCYICRGFVGFMILILIHIGYALIRYGLF